MLGSQQRRKYYEGITDAAEIMRVARQFSNVHRLRAHRARQRVARSGDFPNGGGQPPGHRPRPATARHRPGRARSSPASLADYRIRPDGIILGSLLADKMQLKVGDSVTLHRQRHGAQDDDLSAIFRSGNNIIDERRAYVNMRLAQSLLEKPSLVSQIIVTLRDPDRAPAHRAALRAALRPPVALVAGARGGQPAGVQRAADFGGHHGQPDHPAGGRAHLQHADHDRARQGARDRHPALDGLPPARHHGDLRLPGVPHRAARFGARRGLRRA